MRHISKISISDAFGYHALFLAVIRFAVEKYGGTMHTDQATGVTRLEVPEWAQHICSQELKALFGSGKSNQGLLLSSDVSKDSAL